MEANGDLLRPFQSRSRALSYPRLRAFVIRVGLCWVAPLGLIASAESEYESEQHEWESGLHAPVKWEVLTVVEAGSSGGRLERLPDGSLRAPRSVSDRERYTIEASSTLRGITAFRIEVIPENGTVGRNGNAVLSEFTASSMDGKPWTFVAATSTTARAGSGPELAIDGDLATGWSFDGETDRPHAAAFQLKHAIESKTFVFSLSQKAGRLALNRIRILATTHSPPVLELPDAIREAIVLEPTERSDEQRNALIRFYKSTRPRPAAKRK